MSYVDQFSDMIRERTPGLECQFFLKASWNIDDWFARQSVRTGKLIEPLHVKGGFTLVREEHWRGLDARQLPPCMVLKIVVPVSAKKCFEYDIDLQTLWRADELACARDIAAYLVEAVRRLQNPA